MKKALFAAAFLLSTSLFGASVHAADHWKVDPEKSELAFEASQLGATFKGVFGRFDADIQFSPDDLATSKVVVLIDMASADTQSADRDATIVTADWFDVSNWQFSQFETTNFTHKGGSSYEAEADLRIRDVTLPVTLVFDLKIEGDQAVMTGSADLLRTKFGVGQGQFQDTSMIADDVKVLVSLVAERQ